jgi:hypothetical protein
VDCNALGKSWGGYVGFHVVGSLGYVGLQEMWWLWE